MTVTTQTKKVTTAGNGSATTFSFSPIVIFASTDLSVVTTVVATGVETARSEGSGASAWSLGITTFPATGSITYPQDAVTPLESTHTITIKRVLTLEQQTDLNNQGGYFPDVQEEQFDKLVMIDLQQQELIDRTFKFPVSYTGSVSLEIPAPVAADASKILALNSGLTAFEYISPNTSAYLTTVSSTDNAIVRYNGTSGTSFQNSGVTIDDNNLLIAPGGVGFDKGGDIASASPLVLDTDGGMFDVTGTTGFAAITVAAKRLFILQFDAALTMTHGAGTLDLPNGANIATATGDHGLFYATAANTVRCIAFSKRDQTASATVEGLVELATTAETITGTDSARVVTPAGLHGALAGLTDTTITASDTIIFADATASNALKEDTVQGILDLAAAGGKVLQVVEASQGSIDDTTSVTMADTNLTGAITPASTDNKVLVIVTTPFRVHRASGSTQVRLMSATLYRGDVASGTLMDKTTVGRQLASATTNSSSSHGQLCFVKLDSPSSTSEVTYTVGTAVEEATVNSGEINTPTYDSDGDGKVLMIEIAN
jgi:hypothetical protein